MESSFSRRYHVVPDMISPAEVISSFNLELPDAGGRLLTEDMITETIAEAVGMDYLKIDPLKMDLDVVTGTIPRPFALKHLIVSRSNATSTAW